MSKKIKKKEERLKQMPSEENTKKITKRDLN